MADADVQAQFVSAESAYVLFGARGACRNALFRTVSGASEPSVSAACAGNASAHGLRGSRSGSQAAWVSFHAAQNSFCFVLCINN